jgi:hypothetical protein
VLLCNLGAKYFMGVVNTIIQTKTYIQVPLLLPSDCAIVSDTFILFSWKVTTDQSTNGQTLSQKRVLT